MEEPLLATKESDVLVFVVHLAFRPFLEYWEIKLQRKIWKIFFFHYCTQNKLKETELLLNKQLGELREKIQYENRVYIRACKMVLWPNRARVLFELFYKEKYLQLAFKCQMVSVFSQPDVNTREVGRTRDNRRKPRREAEWLPAYRVFSQPLKCLHQAM